MQKQFMFYVVTNLINGKKYYGVHYGYINDSYLGSGKLIKAAIKKYGRDNFAKDCLRIFKTSDEMYAYEREMITEDVIKDNDNYNCAIGGRGISYGTVYVILKETGLPVLINKHEFNPDIHLRYLKSEETKIKIGKSNKGKIRTLVVREKISKSLLGRKNTPEVKLKKKKTKEHKKKLSISNTGKRASALTKQKMSKSRLGLPKSEEHKKKIGDARRGVPRKPWSCERRQKTKESRLNNPQKHSDTTRKMLKIRNVEVNLRNLRAELKNPSKISNVKKTATGFKILFVADSKRFTKHITADEYNDDKKFINIKIGIIREVIQYNLNKLTLLQQED